VTFTTIIASNRNSTFGGCAEVLFPSLVPRLSPRMVTTKSKEWRGRAWYPFTRYHGTNVTDILISKFRRHSRADCPFSYSTLVRVTSFGLLKRKESPGHAVDGARQFVGSNFHHRRVWNEWLPVSPGNLLRCRRHQYNLLSIDLSLPQKLACSSCDVTD